MARGFRIGPATGPRPAGSGPCDVARPGRRIGGAGRVLPAVALTTVLAATAATAQRIPRDEYLRNIPLKHPTLVGQTRASAEVALFGDPGDLAYRDVDPADGIDDRRRQVLEDLALRFSPYLVLNTTSIPMDVRRFMQREAAFPLYVDRWDVSRDHPQLTRSEEIAWQSLREAECDDTMRDPPADLPDCRLRALLDRYDPLAPGPAYRGGRASPEEAPFEVLFFDMPGYDERTWEEAFVNSYTNRLLTEYGEFARTFVHPFVEHEASPTTGRRGYRLILQYWFYYPYNDGAMNHEGDWEHINVVIAPRDDLHEPLSRERLDRILDGDGLEASTPGELVIQKVEYYFHHFVMTLDYTSPNVYLAPEAWEAELRRTRTERRGEEWLWRQTRYYAYEDDAETVVNTHPIGYIGADSKGTDQLLKAPGGSNRDSHGTYPFPAIYKDVGPAGSAERIEQRFDHRSFLAAGGRPDAVPPEGYGRGSVIRFASPERIEIVPDGERVVDLVKWNASARRDWAWLVLPIRWGYPATTSPFSWLVAHTDLGNGAPVGPSYNSAWNRSGDAAGYEAYAPHRFGSLFPLSWQDGFRNDLGYLNFLAPTLAILPPFDLLWRVGAAPFRRLLREQDPIFQTAEHIPYRVLSVASGPAYVSFHQDFVDLIKNRQQIDFVGERLAAAVVAADSIVGGERQFVENSRMTGAQVSLYLGERLVGENAIRHARTTMGVDVALPSIADVFQLRGELNFWEYVGSLRYNLSGGGFLPFVKAGYGWTWYRVENVTTDGEPLPEPDGPWVDRPSLRHPSTLVPNTWHVGAGIEWIPRRSYAPIPSGIDLGIRGSAVLSRHSLGLDLDTVVPTTSGFLIGAGQASSPVVWRPAYTLELTVSF